MKNLIEGLMSIVFVAIMTTILTSLVLAESEIINQRNAFYRQYEECLNNDRHEVTVKGEAFSIEIPLVGTIVDNYQFEGYIR